MRPKYFRVEYDELEIHSLGNLFSLRRGQKKNLEYNGVVIAIVKLSLKGQLHVINPNGSCEKQLGNQWTLTQRNEDDIDEAKELAFLPPHGDGGLGGGGTDILGADDLSL